MRLPGPVDYPADKLAIAKETSLRPITSPLSLRPVRPYLPAMRTLSDIAEEYDFLEGDERYRLLIELGRDLEPMPDALKTDATLVRGCSAQVWVYPTGNAARLHFLADSNAAIAATEIIESLFITLSSLPYLLGVVTERVPDSHTIGVWTAAADDSIKAHRQNLRDGRVILCFVYYNRMI